MISDKDRKKVGSRVDYHPKLLNQRLPIEEVVGCDKEVPGAILLREIFNNNKNCEKAVRLTAWVDPHPPPSPKAVRKM